MYFLKIYRFWGANHLLVAGGGPKVKNVKNEFQNMHFLQKIDFPEKF